MQTTNCRERLVRPDAPLTWEDIREVGERLGVRPEPKQHKKKRSDAARRVHAAYRAWLDRQDLTGSGYVMSLSAVQQQLTSFTEDGAIRETHRERCFAAREARRVIVAALNDPHSGLAVVQRPLHRYRR